MVYVGLSWVVPVRESLVEKAVLAEDVWSAGGDNGELHEQGKCPIYNRFLEIFYSRLMVYRNM